MARFLYSDRDPGNGKPGTVLEDRIQPMRTYFAKLGKPAPHANSLKDVMDLYPELFVDDTHRLAVLEIWKAGGHMVDSPGTDHPRGRGSHGRP